MTTGGKTEQAHLLSLVSLSLEVKSPRNEYMQIQQKLMGLAYFNFD